MTLEEWDRTLKGMTIEEYDREIRRRVWRRRLKTVGEIAGGVAAIALFALLAWLFLVITPDQMSAECERLYAETVEMPQHEALRP